MNDINSSKNELRKKYIELRMSLKQEDIASASAEAVKRLAALSEFAKAESVILYYPIKNEADPTALIDICKDLGKKVAFPKSNTYDFSLDFFCISSKSDLAVGAFNIPEPDELFEHLSPNERTLCIVPALLYSKDGHRLGYGKGFYDRFLSHFAGKSVGFALDAFVTEHLPCDKHDEKLDIIVTENNVTYCK